MAETTEKIQPQMVTISAVQLVRNFASLLENQDHAAVLAMVTYDEWKGRQRRQTETRYDRYIQLLLDMQSLAGRCGLQLSSLGQEGDRWPFYERLLEQAKERLAAKQPPFDKLGQSQTV